jgi:hypothetical protein
MTGKAEFNAEEWSTLVEGPLFAAMEVAAAERGGSIREGLAVGRAYKDMREHHPPSQLLDDLVSSPPAVDPREMQKDAGADIKGFAKQRLQEAARLADEKATPEEASAYKQFALTVAEAAAKAHKEGGFMGIGGTPVSESEQAALDDIRATLRL